MSNLPFSVFFISAFVLFLVSFLVQVSYEAPTVSSKQSELKNSASFVYVMDFDLNGDANEFNESLEQLSPEYMRMVRKRYQDAKTTLLSTAKNLGYIPIFAMPREKEKTFKNYGVQGISSDFTKPSLLAWDAGASMESNNLEFTNYLFQHASLRELLKSRYPKIEELLNLKVLPTSLTGILIKVATGEKFKEGIRIESNPFLMIEVVKEGNLRLGFQPLINPSELHQIEMRLKDPKDSLLQNINLKRER